MDEVTLIVGGVSIVGGMIVGFDSRSGKAWASSGGGLGAGKPK